MKYERVAILGATRREVNGPAEFARVPLDAASHQAYNATSPISQVVPISEFPMSAIDRRKFLKGLLGGMAQAAGTVIVASAVVTDAQGAETPSQDVLERADRLADSGLTTDDTEALCAFLNGGFRNTPLGAFRNAPLGAFRNTPLGTFRNGPVGGFRNTPLNVFGNGGWPNGGWGGFRNGGWPNGVWRNWW